VPSGWSCIAADRIDSDQTEAAFQALRSIMTRFGGVAVQEARKLRELAVWYREFAEGTENPTIWDARLRTADDLDGAAERIERAPQPELSR
jgi:hypothetical protein